MGRQKLIKLEAEIYLERAQDSTIYKCIQTVILSASRPHEVNNMQYLYWEKPEETHRAINILYPQFDRQSKPKRAKDGFWAGFVNSKFLKYGWKIITWRKLLWFSRGGAGLEEKPTRAEEVVGKFLGSPRLGMRADDSILKTQICEKTVEIYKLSIIKISWQLVKNNCWQWVIIASVNGFYNSFNLTAKLFRNQLNRRREGGGFAQHLFWWIYHTLIEAFFL